MSAPREGRWIAKPRRPRFGIAWVAFLGIPLQLLIQLPNLLSLWKSRGDYAIFFVFWAVIVGCALWLAVHLSLAKREGKRDRALVDADLEDQFTAEITIQVGDRRIGADRGVVWFADGLMGFSGRATSFLLAASDVVPLSRNARILWERRSSPPGALVLVDAPHRNASVFVTPLGRHDRAYRDRLIAFVDAAETPQGERQWPPLAPYVRPNKPQRPEIGSSDESDRLATSIREQPEEEVLVQP